MTHYQYTLYKRILSPIYFLTYICWMVSPWTNGNSSAISNFIVLVKSTLIQCPLITVCSSTETEYCPRRRKKRFISGPNSSDEGRSDEDNVKLRTRAKSEISSYSRLRWFLHFLSAYIYWNSLCAWIPKKAEPLIPPGNVKARPGSERQEGRKWKRTSSSCRCQSSTKQDLVSALQKTDLNSIPQS